jgi:hypothetical protein
MIGPIINDGTISLSQGASIMFESGYTQLGGSVRIEIGPYAPNAKLYMDNGTLSARGVIEASVSVNGPVNMGPTPARLTMGNTRYVNGSSTTLGNLTTLLMRLGSKASGIQDTLVDSTTITLGGTLVLHSIPGNFPAVGDTFTIITGTSVNGTFSMVTFDGVPAAGTANIIYGPTSVKVAILHTPAGVRPPVGEPARALRFAPSGTPRRPAFALSLPSDALVRVWVFDVAGRAVSELVDGVLPAGEHELALPAHASANGVYFARAEVRSAGGAGNAGTTGSIRVLTTRVVQVR